MEASEAALLKPKRGRKKKIPTHTIKTETDPLVPPSLLYDLCGLVSHKGESLSQGHYISYVKAEEGWTQITTEKKGGDGNPTIPSDARSTETPSKRRKPSDRNEVQTTLAALATSESGAEKKGRGRPKSLSTSDHCHPSLRRPDTWVK